MTDVIIKNVPEGAENSVKDMAMIAIERFIKTRDVKVTEEITNKFKTDVNIIRVANDLREKYIIKEKEIEEPVNKEIIEEVSK